MNLKNRWMRWGIAIVAVGLIATQIPYTNTKAAVAADYTNTGGDNSGNFLGIGGVTNRDAIETAVIGVTIYGVYAATTGSSGAGGGSTPKNPTTTPDNPNPPATTPPATTPPATR